MRLPTIHRNGTSAESLYEDACTALGALRAAVRALEQAAPNARDYYPQGDSAIDEVFREHDARVERVVSVIRELETVVEHIADAQDRGHR